jgi:hypothetical protein
MIYDDLPKKTLWISTFSSSPNVTHDVEGISPNPHPSALIFPKGCHGEVDFRDFQVSPRYPLTTIHHHDEA